MSQAGELNVISNNPSIPTMFVTNNGTATPAANILDVLGTGSINTSAPGNSFIIDIALQGLTNHNLLIGQGTATIGLIPPVQAGYVLTDNGPGASPTYQPISSEGAIIEITTDDPTVVMPVTGNINLIGQVVGNSTIPKPLFTHSPSAGNIDIQLQVTTTSTSGGKNVNFAGICSFNSTFFTVDGPTGFVSASGTGLGQTITGQSGGALSPTAGNWNIIGNGVSGSGTSTAGNIFTTGSGSTLTINNTQAQFATNYTLVDDDATPYTVLATDYYISCDVADAALTLKFPNAPTTTRIWIIKDLQGAASTNNISITSVGGAINFDGSTTYKIVSNYGSVQLLFNGTSYEVY